MAKQKRQPSYQWQNHLRTLRGWKTRRHNDYWRDFWARFYIILVFTLGLIAMALIGYFLTKIKEINDIQLHEQYVSQVIEKQIPLKFTKEIKIERVEAKKPIMPAKPESPKVWNAQEYAKNKTIEIWGIQEWNAHYKLVMKESGWNNYAKNPRSTATGYYQFLDGTWQSVGFQKTYDPKTQIDAGTTYILQRYGSPSQALQFHYRNNYY